MWMALVKAAGLIYSELDLLQNHTTRLQNHFMGKKDGERLKLLSSPDMIAVDSTLFDARKAKVNLRHSHLLFTPLLSRSLYPSLSHAAEPCILLS